jgi:threonine/homoserine/homoserine lactone efflux protein
LFLAGQYVDSAALIAFTVVGAAITVSPGPDSLLVLRTAVIAGPRKAFAAAAGVCTGLLAWALSAAFGISAVLAESALLYDFLKWAGAAYLCRLGVRLVLRSKHQSISTIPDSVDVRRDQSFSIGLLTNISNPKVGVFYVSLLPQFVPDGVSAGLFMAGLATIHIAEGALWFAVLILATRPLSRWLARPNILRILDRLTGVILIGLGVHLAFDRR